MLFQQVVGLDDNDRGRGFETNPALDADNGITYMDVPAYAIRLGNSLQMLYRGYRVAEFLPVDSPQLSLFEFQLEMTHSCLGDSRRPGVFRQIFLRSQRFLPADRSTP